MKFKTGDIVQLKSGGPKMTVCGTTNPMKKDEHLCKWFAGAKLETGFFKEDELQLAVEESKKK
jgi:uncharacterized protein YodC (DUF2158 family)